MDICICETANCPKMDTCLRACIKPYGIYTASDLHPVCNQNTEYAYYIRDERKDSKSDNPYQE